MKYLLIITLLFLNVNCRGQQCNEITELKSIIASDAYPNIDGVIISQNGNLPPYETSVTGHLCLIASVTKHGHNLALRPTPKAMADGSPLEPAMAARGWRRHVGG